MHGLGVVIAALCLIQRTWMPPWNDIITNMLVFWQLYLSVACRRWLILMFVCLFIPIHDHFFPLNLHSPWVAEVLCDKPRCLYCIQTLFLWQKLKPVSAGAEGTKESTRMVSVPMSLRAKLQCGEVCFYALAFFAPLAVASDITFWLCTLTDMGTT